MPSAELLYQTHMYVRTHPGRDHNSIVKAISKHFRVSQEAVSECLALLAQAGYLVPEENK